MATEDFSGSDGTQLTAYSANWTLGNALASDWILQSNAIRTPFARVALSAFYGGSFSADHYAEGKILQIGSPTQYLGVSVRATAGNFYGFGVDGIKYVIWKITTPGGYGELAFANATVNAGDIIRFEASGTTLTAKVNGSTIATITDATLSTGSPGLAALPNASSGTYTLLDDWVGNDLNVAAPQHWQYGWPHQLHARK